MIKIEKQLSLVSVAAALALSACAGPPENQMLNQARSSYSVARNDPQVIQKAPLELNNAAKTLQEAEGLYEADADPGQVTHMAYLANQQVAIAREAAQLKLTEEAIANAEEQRRQVLFQAKSSEAERARAEVARTQSELEQARSRLSDTERARQADLAQAQLRETPRGVVLTMKDVVFPVGKAELNPGAERSINKIAEFLQQHPDRTVVIEGFTDSTGSDEFNRQLSESRAEAVRNALVQQGIEAERITAQGLGEQFPVASNETPAGRQLNRRVEIILSGGAEGVAGVAGRTEMQRRAAGEMPMMGTEGMNLHSAGQLIGATVRDRQGQEIGQVRDVMINFEKGRAGFARISSRDGKSHVVPLSALTSAPGATFVTLNADRSLIETSPQPQRGMTEEQYGRALYEHYGLSYPWEETPGETPMHEKGMPGSSQ